MFWVEDFEELLPFGEIPETSPGVFLGTGT
jgi:hypothetical protein